MTISSWKAFCDRRGGGEKVIQRGIRRETATDGGAVGWRKEQRTIQKQLRHVRAGAASISVKH